MLGTAGKGTEHQPKVLEMQENNRYRCRSSIHTLMCGCKFKQNENESRFVAKVLGLSVSQQETTVLSERHHKH